MNERKLPFSVNILKILYVLNGILVVFFLTTLVLWNNLDQILSEPPISPEQYLNTHPWVLIEIGEWSMIWAEPSSSILVYILGILTITIGVLLENKGRKSGEQNLREEKLEQRLCTSSFVRIWGVALIIWGIGTMAAGTSYQALFYELKCSNRAVCLWTTWWEIVYLVLTVLSINGMVLAQSKLRSLRTKIAMRIYASANMAIYLTIITLGMLLVNPFMLSFEVMVLLQFVSFLFMMIQNVIVYRKTNAKIERSLIKIWLGMAVVMISYFGFYYSTIPELLWTKGIWFNANDLLHVGLILWMTAIFYVMNKQIRINNQ